MYSAVGERGFCAERGEGGILWVVNALGRKVKRGKASHVCKLLYML
jgi:hypothetical protein